MPDIEERLCAAEELELFHEMCIEFKRRKKLDKSMQEAADGMRSLYDSLIEAGFTRDEAMTLVRDTLRSCISQSFLGGN